MKAPWNLLRGSLPASESSEILAVFLDSAAWPAAWPSLAHGLGRLARDGSRDGSKVARMLDLLLN